MNHLDNEIRDLKDDIVQMWRLVRNQLYKAEKSLSEFDKGVALDVISQEKRVDAYDLKINMECENLLALYHPVAVDLRFILASLKITYNLERIGDYAKSIAKIVDSSELECDNELIGEVKMNQMFYLADTMLSDALKAFENEDMGVVTSIFKNDEYMNELNRNSKKIIGSYIQRNPLNIEKALNLHSVIRKLERVGDQAKSISEEIIFFKEAKVIRHKKELAGEF